MKTRSWIFLLFCLTSTICQAQFPAPLQFKMSYIYITLDDYGPCCGIMVYGVVITSISLPDTNFIDTKDIAKGVYIVRITTKEAKVFTKTIVIK